MSCGRAQEFLAQDSVAISRVTDAKKQPIGKREALAITRDAAELYVAKGTKVVRVDLRKDAPSDTELLKLVLGPSGNLRAPAIRAGKTLLIGFHPEAYAEVLRTSK